MSSRMSKMHSGDHPVSQELDVGRMLWERLVSRCILGKVEDRV